MIGQYDPIDSQMPVRHERAGQRRPAGLMRGAEALAGVAVEIFVEQQELRQSGRSESGDLILAPVAGCLRPAETI